MTETFTNTLNMFSNYIGDGLYMIIFLLAFLAVCILVKDKKQRSFLLGYFILMQIIYWCPISAYLITEFGMDSNVYWRMFWLLPMVPITAWGLTLLVGRIKKLPLKAAGAILASVLLILCGNSMYKNDLFQKSPNSYKLPEEVFGICDTILEDAGANDNHSVKVAMPGDIVCYVRQYTSRIRLAYGRDGAKDDYFDTSRNHTLFDLIHSASDDALALSEGTRDAKCEYLVLYDSDSRNEALPDYQFTELTRVNNYVVYRVD